MHLKFVVFILAVSSIFTGCVSPDQYRQTAFNDYQSAFTMYDADESIQKTIVIERLIVHIVGDHEKLRAAGHPNASCGCAGWSNTNNEICVLGRRNTTGNIILNQAILGWEMNCILNFADGTIINPHDIH